MRSSSYKNFTWFFKQLSGSNYRYFTSKIKPIFICFPKHDFILDQFVSKISSIIPKDYVYVVFIKVRYNLGSCTIGIGLFGFFNFSFQSDIRNLFIVVSSKLEHHLARYKLNNEAIVYVQISFRQIDSKLLSESFLKKSCEISDKIRVSDVGYSTRFVYIIDGFIRKMFIYPYYYLFVFIIAIILFISFSDVIYCMPPYDWPYPESDTPPHVNMEGKPVFVPHQFTNSSVPSNIHELPTHITLENSSLNSIESLNSSTRANVGVESSVNTIDEGLSNSSGSSTPTVHELNANTSPSSSLLVEGVNNSVRSNIQELGVDTSERSSLLIEDGSNTSAVFNDNLRYHAPQPNEYCYGEGFVAPNDTLVSSPCDPTINEHRAPLGYKVITTLKGFEGKMDDYIIKYYGVGKRKIYWQIWEKRRGRFNRYQDFKPNFDPKTKIFSKIGSDIKDSLKSELKDLFYIKDSNVIRGNTTTEVHKMLRKTRPFKKGR